MSSASPKLYGIIVAAGLGTRLGSDLPKALVVVQGKSILSWCLEHLQRAAVFKKIFITYPASYRPQYEEIVSEGDTPVVLVEGGETRQCSVKAALNILAEENPEREDLVLIHDAARCAVEEASVKRVLATAKEKGAATLALPQTDTVKKVDPVSKVIKESVPRENLWRIQTPQVFYFEEIQKAHELSNLAATDDATLVQQFREVFVVPGDERNFKVTTSWDIEVLKLLFTRHDFF